MDFKNYLPSIVYIFFSISKVITDFSYGYETEGYTKLINTILISILLYILCDAGFEGVAWVIVFIPFLLMSLLTGTIFYFLNYGSTDNNPQEDTCLPYVNETNFIRIYYPNIPGDFNRIYYDNPYIILPKN